MLYGFGLLFEKVSRWNGLKMMIEDFLAFSATAIKNNSPINLRHMLFVLLCPVEKIKKLESLGVLG